MDNFGAANVRVPSGFTLDTPSQVQVPKGFNLDPISPGGSIRWDLYKEAYDRGILPPEKKALYEEAVSRGLAGGKKYTVQDSHSGKKITFEWNGEQPPTDADMEEVFAQAGVGAGGGPGFGVGGTFQPSGEISTITGKPLTKYVGGEEPEAGFGAMLQSSFVNDPYSKAKIYAESRGIPISRYRLTPKGEIEFKNDVGHWQREVSELPTSKLEGLAADVLGHPSTYLAPLAAAKGGGALAMTGAAAGGEALRKIVAKGYFKEPIQPASDLTDIGMQAIFGLVGGGAGKTINYAIDRVLNRAVLGGEGPGILRRAAPEIAKAGLSIEDQARAEIIQKLADQYGMHLELHQLFDKRSLTDTWLYLKHHITTSDAIQTIDDALQKSTAGNIETFIQKMGGYAEIPSSVGSRLKETSENIISKAERGRTEAVRPLYEEAFNKQMLREEAGGGLDLAPAVEKVERLIDSYPDGRIKNGLKAIRNMITVGGKEFQEVKGPYGYLPDPFVERPKETLVGWIRGKGGINPKDYAEEFSVKEGSPIGVSSKAGLPIDELLHQAMEEGWVSYGTTERSFVNLIKADVRSATEGQGSRVARLGEAVRVTEPKMKQVEVRTPETDLRKVQKFLFELDDLINGTSYEASQIAPSSKKVLNRELQDVKETILGQIKAVNPEFIAANEKYAELSPPIDRLKRSVVGELTRLKQLKSETRAPALLMSPENMPDPNLLREARNLISGEDKTLWHHMVGTYIRDVYEGLKATQGEGKVANLPGKLYQQLFGSTDKQEIMQAALTPKEYQNFSDLMTLFQRAAIGSGQNSMTMPFAQIDRNLRGEGVKQMAELAISPTRKMTEWITEKMQSLLTSGRQEKLLDALTAPDVLEKIRSAKRLRPGSEQFIRAMSELTSLMAEKTRRENP